MGGVRLWPLVDTSNGDDHCWKWLGATSSTSGYGVARGNNQRMTTAHRAIWEMVIGDIPADLNVLHMCDYKLCVNPGHLFLGTQKENIADAREKGHLSGGPRKSQKGSGNNASKYTEEQIIEVKRLLDLDEMTQRAIAKLTGVHYNMVWHIKKGDRWINA